MELSGYYFAGLNLAEQFACQDIANAMEQGKESVKLSLPLTGDSMGRIFKAIQYERPELFFVDFTHMNTSFQVFGRTYPPQKAHYSGKNESGSDFLPLWEAPLKALKI